MNKLKLALILLSLPLILDLSSCGSTQVSEAPDIDLDKTSQSAALNDKASSYKLQGDLEKALSEYKTIAKNTESNSALITEGNTLMTLGRFEEAQLPLKQACEQNFYNTKSSALCDYILCLTALKKYEECAKNIERSNGVFDRDGDFVAARALTLLERNSAEEALLRLEQYCRQAEPEARIYYLRALILKKLKREDEAKRILNIATLIYPNPIIMKSGKRMSPITTPLYADCTELFIKLNRPDRAAQTVALADVLGERSVRITILDAEARAKLKSTQSLSKAESLIATEKQFWNNLKSSIH